MQTKSRVPFLNYKFLVVILISVLASACGSNSLDDFREEGRSTTRSLVKLLKQIHTRDELDAYAGRLKIIFNRLSDVMINAHIHAKDHQEEDKGLTAEDHHLSDALRIELNRICRMTGGRERIEKCQEEALHRLNLYLDKSKISAKGALKHNL